MPLHNQGKGIQSQQNNEIHAVHPTRGNWPYDADSIGTDQNLNADARRDPHPQTDGVFLAHGQTGPHSKTPGQPPALSPYGIEKWEKAGIGSCGLLVMTFPAQTYQRSLGMSTTIAIELQQSVHDYTKNILASH